MRPAEPACGLVATTLPCSRPAFFADCSSSSFLLISSSSAKTVPAAAALVAPTASILARTPTGLLPNRLARPTVMPNVLLNATMLAMALAPKTKPKVIPIILTARSADSAPNLTSPN